MIARTLRYTIERHGLHRALQISETRTRTIIESNIDGITIVDGKGVVRFANVVAEALFSRSATLVGEAFGFPIISDIAQELEVLQLDDTVCLVEMRATDIDWDGQPAYLISLRDITKKRKAEEALHQSELLKKAIVERH
ncbi:MAG: hypothetical protein IPL78_29235 [Chloroflexi bacterium]|nr:hypothetical protein [Chloroflexota bacterium]